MSAQRDPSRSTGWLGGTKDINILSDVLPSKKIHNFFTSRKSKQKNVELVPRPARLQVPLEAQRSDHHEKKVQCQQNQYETLERDSGNGSTLARAELASVSEDP